MTIDHDLAGSLRELETAQRELVVISDKLAAPRIRWRSVCNSIAEQCFAGDEDTRTLHWWRPLGAGNIARLNAARAAFLSVAGPLIEDERAAKARVAAAKARHEAALAASRKARSPAGHPAPAGASRAKSPHHQVQQVFEW